MFGRFRKLQSLHIRRPDRCFWNCPKIKVCRTDEGASARLPQRHRPDVSTRRGVRWHLADPTLHLVSFDPKIIIRRSAAPGRKLNPKKIRTFPTFIYERGDRPQVRDATAPQVTALRPRMHSARRRRDIANLLTPRRGARRPATLRIRRPARPLPVHPKASKILNVSARRTRRCPSGDTSGSQERFARQLTIGWRPISDRGR